MLRNRLLNNRNILIRPQENDVIDFSLALKSIDLPSYQFMNYFTSNQTKIYIELQKMYNASLDNHFQIDKYFTSKDYSALNALKNERIKRFIRETSNTNITNADLNELIKYKNKDNPNFQLFVKYNRNESKAHVYLIDIYHLVIPTANSKINRNRVNTEEYYSLLKSKLHDSACGLETLQQSDFVSTLESEEILV